MSLAGRQTNPIDVIFHLQKSMEILNKNSASQKLSLQNEKKQRSKAQQFFDVIIHLSVFEVVKRLLMTSKGQKIKSKF